MRDLPSGLDEELTRPVAVAPAYTYVGPASHVRQSGDRPMRIIWRLDHELPDDVFQQARLATG